MAANELAPAELKARIDRYAGQVRAELRRLHSDIREEQARADREARTRRDAEARAATLREEKANAANDFARSEAERSSLASQLDRMREAVKQAEKSCADAISERDERADQALQSERQARCLLHVLAFLSSLEEND